jgi:hypothetical protein
MMHPARQAYVEEAEVRDPHASPNGSHVSTGLGVCERIVHKFAVQGIFATPTDLHGFAVRKWIWASV